MCFAGDQDTWAAAFAHPKLRFEGSLPKLPQLIGAQPVLFEKLVVAEKERWEADAAVHFAVPGASAGVPEASPSSSSFITLLTEAMLSAIVSSNAQTVDICLRHGAFPATPVPFAFGQKTTALHVAAEKKETAIMRRLVQEITARKRPAEETDINARADDGGTALHRACELGMISLAKYLVLNGANPDLRDKEYQRPLDMTKMWYRGKYSEMKEVVDAARQENNWQRRKAVVMAYALAHPSAGAGGAGRASSAATGAAKTGTTIPKSRMAVMPSARAGLKAAAAAGAGSASSAAAATQVETTSEE